MLEPCLLQPCFHAAGSCCSICYSALYYMIVSHITIYHMISYYIISCYNTLWYTIVQYIVLNYTMVQHVIAQHRPLLRRNLHLLLHDHRPHLHVPRRWELQCSIVQYIIVYQSIVYYQYSICPSPPDGQTGSALNGVAAKGNDFDRLGEKVRHIDIFCQTLTDWNPKSPSVEKHEISSDAISADPICPFPSSAARSRSRSRRCTRGTLGWHYSSSTTCLIQASFVLCASRCVNGHHNLAYYGT